MKEKVKDKGKMGKTKTGKKKNKVQGVSITDMDMDIFKYMSSGCATFPELLVFFKQMRDGDKIKYKNTLRARLTRLRRSGYILSREYVSRGGTTRHALYILGESAKYILAESGYPPEKIRGVLPNDYTVSHELAVTSIVRAIKKESEKSNYECQIYDETTLKTIAGGVSKSEFYPDLHVTLKFSMGGEQRNKAVSIEYDNGTLMVSRILKKAREQKGSVIFICATTKRMDDLRSFIGSANDASELRKRVFFGLLEDIYSNGILGANFQTLVGGKLRII
jgi:hypothetical protein